jgi:prolipoprotein diacylglyceryl transferase
MRPILVQVPSKLLFVVLLVTAAALLARDLLRRRRVPAARMSLTPLLLAVGALVLMRYRSPIGSFVPEVGMFSQPWLPVPIFAYGVMLGTAMVGGWFLVMRFAKQDGLPLEAAGAIYMWSAVWSLIGSRLLHVVIEHETYLKNPVEIFKIWNGGLVAYGGMIVGTLSCVFLCRKRNVPLLQWADVAAPSVVLGTAVTRVGCLMFGCDYGKTTNVPWAIRFPGPSDMAARGSPAFQDHVSRGWIDRTSEWSLSVHPTQIYESLVGLSLFGLLVLIRHYRRFSGQVFVAWIIGYGVLRSIIEVFRGDEDRGVSVLSTSQFIGIGSSLFGVVLLVLLWRRYRRDPESLRLWGRPVAEPATAVGAAEAQGPPARAGRPGAASSGRRRKKRR